MTKYRKFLLVVISVMIFGILFIMQSSVISDVTLAKGDVENYNNGWTIEYADGSTVKTDLPYFGHAGKYETVTASNTIGDKMSDKTIFFLSADKTIEIYVDDEIIYTFGTVDKREIGHTSGSVMVFADLPNYSAGKTLYIKTCSPYEGYASYFTEVKVADRDIAILYFIKNNIVALLLCIAILLCGLVTIIFAMVFQYSGQAKKARRFYSIGIYMIIMFIYHLIETKLPMIFKGNQFLYSNLVFFCLMAASLFAELYLHETTIRCRKWINTLIVLSTANIVIQMLLQMFNIVDFMEMAFVSHALLGAVIALVTISEIQEIISRKKFNPEFLGIFIMGSCAAIDLVRCYTVKVGDLGKYSRIGVFVFGISIISTCIKSIVSKQIEAAENEKTEIMSGEIIRTLITAIDAKDVYTKGHSQRVAEYSVKLAKAMGWDRERVERLHYMALLHDVGKIGIPDRVLNKNGKLTDEEFAIIKSHTVIGSDMLRGMTIMEGMHLVAKHHHERFDGRGYPDGLAGEDIPIEARLVCVADAYDAMASDRAYRKALSKDDIRFELIRNRGSQFDPAVLDKFILLFDSGVIGGDKRSSTMPKSDIYLAKEIEQIIEAQISDESVPADSETVKGIVDAIKARYASYAYGDSFKEILISLSCEEDIDPKEMEMAMKAMDYCLEQSDFSGGIITRLNDSQYIVIGRNMNDEAVGLGIDKLRAGFYRNSTNIKIKSAFEVM